MEKTIYCIRHGYALHNKLFWDIGRRAYSEFRDTPLLEEGYNQAKQLGKNWSEINNIQLVVVSPCTRTLETASFIFKDRNIPFIAKDFLVEYPLGGEEICNQRKDIEDLEFKYPYVIFHNLPEKLKWDPLKEETLHQLDDRIEEMFHWIGQRKETNIAVVSHSSFIGRFKDRVIGDEEHELKHCYPYKINVKYSADGKFISMKNLND